MGPSAYGYIHVKGLFVLICTACTLQRMALLKRAVFFCLNRNVQLWIPLITEVDQDRQTITCCQQINPSDNSGYNRAVQ